MAKPNSTGQFGAIVATNNNGPTITTGVFSDITDLSNDIYTIGEKGVATRIVLDLHGGSSIYNGSKLQPSALQTLACIKF